MSSTKISGIQRMKSNSGDSLKGETYVFVVLTKIESTVVPCSNQWVLYLQKGMQILGKSTEFQIPQDRCYNFNGEDNKFEFQIVCDKNLNYNWGLYQVDANNLEERVFTQKFSIKEYYDKYEKENPQTGYLVQVSMKRFVISFRLFIQNTTHCIGKLVSSILPESAKTLTPTNTAKNIGSRDNYDKPITSLLNIIKATTSQKKKQPQLQQWSPEVESQSPGVYSQSPESKKYPDMPAQQLQESRDAASFKETEEELDFAFDRNFTNNRDTLLSNRLTQVKMHDIMEEESSIEDVRKNNSESNKNSMIHNHTEEMEEQESKNSQGKFSKMNSMQKNISPKQQQIFLPQQSELQSPTDTIEMPKYETADADAQTLKNQKSQKQLSQNSSMIQMGNQKKIMEPPISNNNTIKKVVIVFLLLILMAGIIGAVISKKSVEEEEEEEIILKSKKNKKGKKNKVKV